MRKLILLFALLAPTPLFAQGAFIPPQTALKNINGIVMPIANATITVCAPGAGGIPCSPVLVNTIFKDAALTQALTNPFTSDANGNYQFASAVGTYTVTVTAPGYAGYSYQITVASGSGGGGGVPNGAITFTNATSVTFPTSFTNKNLLWTCWDNNFPNVNAIYPNGVTLNTSTFAMAFTFQSPQSGFCVGNGSGGGGGGGGIPNPFLVNSSIPNSPPALPSVSTTSVGVNTDGNLAVAANGAGIYDDVPTNATLGYSNAFIWSESPSSPSSLTGGAPATITLPSCPRGLNSAVLTDSIGAAAYFVDIGGTGTAEYAWVSATSCSNATVGQSGTIAITPVNSHSAGYTIGTASQGEQEAINWISGGTHNALIRTLCTQNPVYWDAPVTTHANFVTIDNGGCVRVYQTHRQPLIVMGDHNPGEYFFNQVVNFQWTTALATMPQINYIAAGATWTQSGLQCTFTVPFTAAHDFNLRSGPDADWIVISGFLNANELAGIHQVTAVPDSTHIQFQYTETCPALTGSIYSGGVAVVNYAGIEDELITQGVLRNVSVLNVGATTVANHYLVEYTVDEQFNVTMFNDEQDDSEIRPCTGIEINYPVQAIPEWCGAYFYNPGGHGDAGILNLSNSTIYPFPGNGIENFGGNDLNIGPGVVIENQAEYFVKSSRYRGGFGQLSVVNTHFESANCRYAFPPLGITSFSGTTGTLTFHVSNGLTAGTALTLGGFISANAGLNGQSVTVLSSGLSNTQFEAAVTGSGYSSGTGQASQYPIVPGCSATITSMVNTNVAGGTGVGGGQVPNYGTFGSGNAPYAYFLVPHNSSSDALCTSQPNDQRCVNPSAIGHGNLGSGPAMPIGFALCDSSAGCSSVPIYWWAIRDATSYDLVKVAEPLTSAIMGPVGGATANILVAAGLNPATVCNDTANSITAGSPVCSFTDTTSLSPTSYTTPSYGTSNEDWCPYLDMWSASVVLMCATSQSGSVYATNYNGPAVPFVTTNSLGTTGIQFTNNLSPILTTNGGVQLGEGQLQPFPYGFQGQSGGATSTVPGQTIYNGIAFGTQNDNSTTLFEGPTDFEYQPVLANKHYPRGIFTFEDYCLMCTWASGGRRAANAADTFAAMAAAGSLWFGAHTSINFSINTINPAAWNVEINSSGLNVASGFSLTLSGESSFSGYGACYSTSGVLGHCTSTMNSSGQCTCVSP